MTIAQAKTADSWADGAYFEAGSAAPPVDLHAIARLQKVARIKMRLMVQEGALIPVPGGFEVYIQSLKRRDLSVDAPEPPEALNARQRFTLAHEIAHTRFYNTQGEIPIPMGKVKTKYEDQEGVGLEEICDRAAARLLVPTQILKKEIREALNGNCQRIDTPFVRLMTRRFRVSYDVMIGRLRVVEPQNVFARCLMLIRKSDDEHRLVACYIGATLLSIFPRLEDYIYRPIHEFLPDHAARIVGPTEFREWPISINGHGLLLGKTPTGSKTDFLLQFDDPAHRAPDSDHV
jgi:hypothetical protein